MAHIEDDLRSERPPYNAQENAARKIAFALEYKSLAKRVEELEWWIQVLTAINTDLSLFGEEVGILRSQIEKWKEAAHD